jgi:diguanylate cyclase (GGDEF)-like protein
MIGAGEQRMSGVLELKQRPSLEALEAQNDELKARLKQLTEEASRNDALLRKTRERELDLLGSESLTELFTRLTEGSRASHQLDAAVLTLLDPQGEIQRLLQEERATSDALRDVHFLETFSGFGEQVPTLHAPLLCPYRPSEHAALVPRSQGLASIALLPLRRGGLLCGVLVFGSVDRQRFSPALATDFLAHLASVAAISLENTVNRMRLVRSGLTDFLTGFHNRRYLHARLREELARAQRAGHPVACLMIDVDNFKRINDQHGHPGGDIVLREVARRIHRLMRSSDTTARFGGDEFAIVLPDSDVAGAESVASRILESVRSAPVEIGVNGVENVTLSIGVAVAMLQPGNRDHEATATRLMAEADAALYRAKAAGRNRIEVSRQPIL